MYLPLGGSQFKAVVWDSADLLQCEFYFNNVLKRDWHPLTFFHAKRSQRLPAVLNHAGVRAFF